MPTAVIQAWKTNSRTEVDKASIKSSSTWESKDIDYAPEIVLEGSSNEALKGDSAILDATEEETFTLDSFDKLVRKAFGQGKTFLLARVTTADQNDPSRLYHSYYSAHHINKILFRTQPELSLLHRMRSTNPLNNMPIVGDVDYYIIDRKSVEKAMKNLHIEQKKEEFTKKELSQYAKKHKRTMSDSNYRKFPAEEKKMDEDERESNSYQSTIMEEAINSQTSLIGSVTRNEKKRVRYTATFFATDDDFLMKTEVREVFKRNAVSADDYLLFTLHANAPQTVGANGEIILLEQAMRTPRPPATWSNLFGCINTTATPSLTNRLTGVLTNRGLAVFFVLYLVGAIATLKFLIPLEYVYLAGFLFAFIFVLILVLFVEAGHR